VVGGEKREFVQAANRGVVEVGVFGIRLLEFHESVVKAVADVEESAARRLVAPGMGEFEKPAHEKGRALALFPVFGGIPGAEECETEVLHGDVRYGFGAVFFR